MILSNCTCIENSDGFIYRTLTDYHPTERPISYLKYYPHSKGDRIAKGKSYGRFSNLPQCWETVKAIKPESIYYDKVHGCELVGPDLSKGDYIIWDPIKKTKDLFVHGAVNEVQEAHLELISKLSSECKISKNCFGISGSVLVGLEDGYSDIDLLVYGKVAGNKLMQTLNTIDHLEIKPYKGELLHKLVNRRKKGSVDGYNSEEAIKLEEGKTSGQFKDRHFNISIIRERGEVTPNDVQKIIPMGECEIECVVTNDEEIIFVPPKYQIKVVKLIKGSRESLKAATILGSRFLHSQLAKEGDRLIVKGVLEKEISSDGKESFVISLAPWRIMDGYIKPINVLEDQIDKTQKRGFR